METINDKKSKTLTSSCKITVVDDLNNHFLASGQFSKSNSGDYIFKLIGKNGEGLGDKDVHFNFYYFSQDIDS